MLFIASLLCLQLIPASESPFSRQAETHALHRAQRCLQLKDGSSVFLAHCVDGVLPTHKGAVAFSDNAPYHTLEHSERTDCEYRARISSQDHYGCASMRVRFARAALDSKGPHTCSSENDHASRPWHTLSLHALRGGAGVKHRRVQAAVDARVEGEMEGDEDEGDNSEHDDTKDDDDDDDDDDEDIEGHEMGDEYEASEEGNVGGPDQDYLPSDSSQEELADFSGAEDSFSFHS